jgi:YD repeat-containing protein
MKLRTKKSLKHLKKVALSLVFLMIYQMAFPIAAWALTSGPTQPEVQSFEPIGTTEMVDLFSGDFTYNIPLFEVPGPDGGYPVNLFYNSVTSGETEATMVGLGWNIGIGAINRQMQGLPDDFNGEKIAKIEDVKPNITTGVTLRGSTEIFGGDLKKAKIELGLQLGGTIMHNTYKGWGYSIDPSLSVRMNKLGGLKPNFGFSLSSFDGASVDAGVSIGQKVITELGNFNFGIGLSSRGGNNISLGFTKAPIFSQAATSLINRESPAYTPNIGSENIGLNYSVGATLGLSLTGVYVHGSYDGFISDQRLKNRGQKIYTSAYGYLYGENATSKDLLDINREKDFQIKENDHNLPIPVTTPDLLSVTGHGIGGMYRPYRSDVPIYSDPEVESVTGGATIKGDIELKGEKFGIDVNGNYSQSKVEQVSLSGSGDLGFHGDKANSDYETYYYKSPGELTSEDENIDDRIGGDKPMRLSIKDNDEDKPFYNTGHFKTGKSGQAYGNNTHKTVRESRKPRSSSVQPITNNELLKSNSEEILPHYQIKYYDETNLQGQAINNNQIDIPQTNYDGASKTSLTRQNNDQFAGFTTVTSNGAIWNFALPVKNKVQKDIMFSVPEQSNNCLPTVDVPKDGNDKLTYKHSGTDEFLNITETPEYTHSYMLTSVLGSDYIDVDPTDGEPNEKDRGYWMIIDYTKVSEDYKWRAPFFGANYSKGYNSKTADDKGSFAYGEREVYLPATIRTKTHIAEFHYKKREDGRGAADWLQNDASGGLGDHSYKLKEIKLYSIEEMENSIQPIPIKVVHFQYFEDNPFSLCKNVPNNAKPLGDPMSGKLALEKVWFTYENSNRGALSPYKFEYNGTNEDYDVFQFDGWGTYKESKSGDVCYNTEVPYVDQTLSDADQAENVATWHVSKIILPSGAEINLDIGRDHYGHVQDKVASQMFKIVGTKEQNQSDLNVMEDEDNSPNSDYRVYFELEKPLKNEDDLKPYFEDIHDDGYGKQIYFKTRVRLLGDNDPTPEGKTEEDITGYAYFDSYGFDESTEDANGYHSIGYVEFKPTRMNGEKYHPIVLQARQYIKTNLPDLMYEYTPDEPQTLDDMVKHFFSIAGNIKEIAGAFRNYYNVCRSRNYGQTLATDDHTNTGEIERAYIRLNSPDKLKYGDGVRVNKVTMTDSWAAEYVPNYGMVYNYTAEDGSSYGVATNEPNVSKDESSLRYVKRYLEELKGQTDNWRFFDYPTNESYYPGASVGYSKVTVKSLATDASIQKYNEGTLPPDSDYYGLDGFATSGVTEHEYYTYKDFPIITQETDIDAKKDPVSFRMIVIPLIGQMSRQYYAGSQGYSIELNNMHGKPRSVKNYPQDAQGKVLTDDPISFVTYEYEEGTFVKKRYYGDDMLTKRRLENKVKVLNDDYATATNADIVTAEVGVEREFFSDVRASSSSSFRGGIDFNSEGLGLGPISIPIPIPWPEFGESKTKVRTAVTNKIIRKTGILKRVIAYDGQARVETENLVYDKLTGQPVLTRVNNNYGDPIYSYNIPAYLIYEGMGAAYENWGLKFNASTNTSAICSGDVLLYDVNSVHADIKSKLIEGDEFIVKENGVPVTRATLVHKMTTDLYFKFEDVSGLTHNGLQKFHLIRSGKRNHLSASAGNIVALANPTEGRGTASSNQYTVNEVDNNGTYGTNQKTMDVSQVNDVLSASVVTYKNSWIEGNATSASGDDPYHTDISSQHIWRPNRSYAYVTDREQTNVDLQTEGTFSYKMFDWMKSEDMTLAFPEWREMNQVTRYGSNGAELENKNILGQYSSALYGYNDNLATAVAVNARFTEIGFEGFEEYNTGTAPSNVVPTGHIDWTYYNYYDWTWGTTSETYNVEGFVSPQSDAVVLDENFTNHSIILSNSSTATHIVLNLKDINGKYYFVKKEISTITATNDGKIQLNLNGALNVNCVIPSTINSSPTRLSGDVKIFYAKMGTLTSPLEVVDGGHTGVKSLKVDDVGAVLPQRQLHLKPNKEYIISAWVKLQDANNNDIKDKHTYKDGNNYFKIGTTDIHPVGPIVEGWQKVEGTFSLPSSNSFDINVFVKNNHQLLVDDIRIFPKDGNIQTYVYDPINYRVTEVLDNNNFYTRYEYDEEGNLIILKKETIKGVKTLQESRSHIKSN